MFGKSRTESMFSESSKVQSCPINGITASDIIVQSHESDLQIFNSNFNERFVTNTLEMA